MKKVLVIDTSILCVWLSVPGKTTCGTAKDQWDKARVTQLLGEEITARTTLVLPLATILETGNHIAQANSQHRRETACELAELMKQAADQTTPWAAFTDQSELWNTEALRRLAAEWPDMAVRKISIGDVTIKTVAEYYAQAGFTVEILTADQGLKSYEPRTSPSIPRRRRNSR